MTRRKGQTSLELLLIFAIALFVLTAIILLSSSQIGGISALKEQNDAVNSVEDVSAAAKDVYSQGEGARKQVYIYIPSSYEPAESRIGNRSMVLRVRGSDYAAVEDFDVHGSWPGTPGGHWVWVVSEGNKVRIGTAMISLGRNAISIIMDKSSSASATYDVESIWGSDISVSGALNWPHGNVTVSPSVSSFPLSPAERQGVTLSINSDANAVGFYSGEIAYTAEDGTFSETVRLPITIEVAGYRPDLPPPINVTPDLWALEMQPTNTTTRSFTVCTNAYTSPSSVTFTPSAGAPGSWIGGTAPLGAMAPGTCEIKTMNLSVPNGTAGGAYTGTINVVGEGVAGAHAVISVYILVSNESGDGSDCGFDLDNQSMCNCPVGSNYQEIPLCNCQPGTIYVLEGIVIGGPDNGLPYNGTLRGSSGEDVIVGTNASDIIFAGGTGNDRVCGEGGNDIIIGDNGNDIMDGGDGDDNISGGGSGDIIYGKNGNDLLEGGQGDDQIDGGDGDDTITDAGGKDKIYGGAGNDVISGGDQDDTICGNSEDDIILGGVGKDTIDAGGGSDTIDGGDGVDTCYRGEATSSCDEILGGRYTLCGPT